MKKNQVREDRQPASGRARDCDLIIMASHGQRGMQGLLLGGETQKVRTHSKIPVPVYR